MTMTAAGVAKLIEECAELAIELGSLQQILAKKLAYWHTDVHPDGKGPIHDRIVDEMGDVMAAIGFVVEQLDLDHVRLVERHAMKLRLFDTWQAQIDNNDQAIDRTHTPKAE
jgi:NTP pyrophosphatase (non-canonical NTP hydrolase)